MNRIELIDGKSRKKEDPLKKKMLPDLNSSEGDNDYILSDSNDEKKPLIANVSS